MKPPSPLLLEEIYFFRFCSQRHLDPSPCDYAYMLCLLGCARDPQKRLLLEGTQQRLWSLSVPQFVRHSPSLTPSLPPVSSHR